MHKWFSGYHRFLEAIGYLIPIEKLLLVCPIKRNAKVSVPALTHVSLKLLTVVRPRLFAICELVLVRRRHSAFQTVVFPTQNSCTADALLYFDCSAKATTHVVAICDIDQNEQLGFMLSDPQLVDAVSA